MSLPKPGDVLLSKYELEWELGRGGYGVVYKGTTLSTGRPVAIKVLKPSRTAESPKSVRRFRREMTSVAQLQCPHTMTLYDFGSTDDGVLFMVCEYVEGVDLLDLLVRRRTLKEKYVLDILRQVLLSLSEAHSLGILHRDIKPANIRVEFPENSRLRAKLLDFGLTMRLEGDEDRLTKDGFVVGTPRYMAPEQLRGTAAGPFTDIYSLGVVMVEALLGRGSVNVGDRVELSADDGVHPTLRKILNRMVVHETRDRYGTAADVLADLPRRLGAEDEPEAIPPPPIQHGDDEEPTTEIFEQLDDVSITAPTSTRAYLPFVLLGAVLTLVVAAIVLTLGGASDHNPVRSPPERVVPPPPAPPKQAPDPAAAKPSHEHTASRCADMPDLGPGVHRIDVEDVLATKRVWVFLPPGYDRSQRHRVVLMFPDVQRTGEETMRMVARQPSNPELEDFVVISGLSEGELWFSAGDQMREGWDRMQRLSRKLCIDPDEVFLLGHGAGGAAVLRGMCSWPILAAGIQAFRVRTDREICRKPVVPLLAIDVEENPYAPLEGGLPCTAPITVRPLKSQDRKMKNVFGCQDPLIREKREDGSICHSSECRVHFESCRVPGGRDWPGTPRLKGPCGSTPGDYRFRDRFWTFFAEQAPADAGPEGGERR